jgi:hypothetical protein
MARLCVRPARRLEFLCQSKHLPDHGGTPAKPWKIKAMTMLHVRQPDISGFVPLASIAGLFRRTGAALGLLHQAVVSAKLRCAHRQLRCRHDYDELLESEHDLRRLPQRPLILGDKWDF